MKIKKKKYFSACQIESLDVAPVCDPGVSLTEPDQSLSIQEILKRVSEGKTTGLTDIPDSSYDDDDDNDFDDPTLQPGFDRLDMLQMSTSSETEDQLDSIRRYKKKKEKERIDKSIDDEVERRIKSRSQQQKSEDPPE